MKSKIIYFLFFISGLVSLHYEVIWFKLLQYLFGSTTYSLSVLLAAFMAGLSLGSYLISKYLITKNAFSLMIYGYLEIFIGVYAAFFYYLFQLAKKIYLIIYIGNEISFVYIIIHFILSFLLLGAPAIAMGATLPLLASYFIKELNASGKEIGFLYFINSLGAFTGTLTSSLYLIEHLGLKNLLFLSSFINLVIGFIAIIFSKSVDNRISRIYKPAEMLSNHSKKISEKAKKLLLIYSISGAISLSYEVLYTRFLSQITLNTVYAFSIMLSAFLLGIALGSFFISFVADKINKICYSLAWFQFLLALFSIIYLRIFPNLFHFSYNIDNRFHGNWSLLLFSKFFLFFISLIPITLIFGAMFPLFSKAIISSLETAGREVGLVYFFNTLGCIAGSLLCGYYLISTFGTSNTALLLITLTFLLSAYLFFLEDKLKKFTKFTFFLLLILFPYIAKLFIKDPISIISNYKIGSNEKILFFKEGVDGNVMVAINKKRNNKILYLNNEWIANTMAPGHKLFGHIPIFLTPGAEKVLVVGLGSGITAKSAILHPSVRELDIVEISKTVVAAAGFFTQDNKDILNNPKVKITIDDVRHFLLRNNKKYDLILHEPLQQWTAGTVNLYTREYYELCKSRLTNYGAITQWIQLNTLSISDLKMIIYTFISSFPNSSGWLIGKELYLIGRKTSYQPSLESLFKNMLDSSAWKDIASDYFNSPWQVFSPLDLFSFHFFNSFELEKISAPSIIIIDDKPVMEYSVARSVSIVDQISSLYFLIKNKDCNQLPQQFIFEEDNLKKEFISLCNSKKNIYFSLISLEKGNLLEAEIYLEKAFELFSTSQSIKKLISESYLGLASKAQDKNLILKYYYRALNICPFCYNALLKNGEIAEISGNMMNAQYYYSEAIKNKPNLPEAYNHLAILYSNSNFKLSEYFFKKAISLARYSEDYYHNLNLLKQQAVSGNQKKGAREDHLSDSEKQSDQR